MSIVPSPGLCVRETSLPILLHGCTLLTIVLPLRLFVMVAGKKRRAAGSAVCTSKTISTTDVNLISLRIISVCGGPQQTYFFTTAVATESRSQNREDYVF